MSHTNGQPVWEKQEIMRQEDQRDLNQEDHKMNGQFLLFLVPVPGSLWFWSDGGGDYVNMLWKVFAELGNCGYQ